MTALRRRPSASRRNTKPKGKFSGKVVPPKASSKAKTSTSKASAKGQKRAPLSPNAATIEAMEAARRGELSGPFNSIDELFVDLNAGD